MRRYIVLLAAGGNLPEAVHDDIFIRSRPHTDAVMIMATYTHTCAANNLESNEDGVRSSAPHVLRSRIVVLAYYGVEATDEYCYSQARRARRLI